VVGCERVESEDSVKRDLNAVHDLSIPPDASHHVGGPLRREPYAVSLEWSFETTMTWSGYMKWLRSRLPKGFEQRSKEATTVQFSRRLQGDVYSLQVTQLEDGRIGLKLVSRPF